MITDTGLERVASYSWPALINYPILGEGSTPTAVRRDSNPITFTQSGTTLTASSGFFVSGDVGRLFKWGTGTSGNEIYITGFTSSTVVTVGTSATVSTPDVGTIWYVNVATLQTFISGLTWSNNNDGAENYSSITTSGDTATVTHQRTSYSSSFTLAKTVTEIGFGDTNANSNLFDRDLVTPSVGFLVGDQAKITVQLVVKYSPITAVSVGNVGTGYDTSGQVQIESLSAGNYGIAIISSSGSTSEGSGNLEPKNGCYIQTRTSNTAFQGFGSTQNTSGTFNGAKNCSASSYTANSHYRDTTGTFSISENNGTFYDVFIGCSGVISGSLFRLKFTTAPSKLNTQTLSFTFRKSWSRTLTN